jgi:transcriptional regulator with XRE-family HTH domain
LARIESTRDTVPVFGRGVKAARDAKGWSLAVLAERSGVAAPSISRVETAARAPSLRLALRLARALGTTVDRLAKGWDAAENIAE